MRLLVTRPIDDSLALKTRLEELGHQVLCAPLLEIHFRAGERPNLQGVQGILVTSANGVAALVQALGPDERRRLPIFAVGEASAAAARKAGFERVQTAGGDSLSLAHLVRRRCQPDNGPLLHVSGQAVAGDLRGQLGAEGYDVRRIVLYDAAASRALPEPVVAALRAGDINGVLLYSARTARIFLELIAAAGLDAALRGMTAYCLSPAVADALGVGAFGVLKVAPAPREPDLLALIGRA